MATASPTTTGTLLFEILDKHGDSLGRVSVPAEDPTHIYPFWGPKVRAMHAWAWDHGYSTDDFLDLDIDAVGPLPY